MSLCENVKDYSDIIKSELGITGEARILNMQYSKDTGQFTIQLQEDMTDGTKKKHKLKAVVLSEEKASEMSGFILSNIYPVFEAKQAEKVYIREYAEKKSEAEKELAEFVKEIEEEYEEKINTEIEQITAKVTEKYSDAILEIHAEKQIALKSLSAEKEKVEDKDSLMKLLKEEQELGDEYDKKIQVVNEEKSAELSGSTETIKAKLVKEKESLIEDKRNSLIAPLENDLQEKKIEIGKAYGLDS